MSFKIYEISEADLMLDAYAGPPGTFLVFFSQLRGTWRQGAPTSFVVNRGSQVKHRIDELEFKYTYSTGPILVYKQETCEQILLLYADRDFNS